MQAEITERQRQYREEYLRSPHWRQTRLAALGRAGNRCQVCNGAKQLDVHHRTYERIGKEADGDLTVLCRECHALFHDAGPGIARTKKPGHADPGIRRGQRKSAKPGANRAKVAEILPLLKPGVTYTARDIATLADVHLSSAAGAAGQLVKQGALVKVSKKRFRLPPRLRHNAALESTCPTCGAPPGQACPMGGVHMARYRDAPKKAAA
jgi:hypothetical protein